MRVTSAFWVGAYIRRCYGAGAIATVARHGAEEAGAILVVVDWLDGTADLFVPAPQSFFDDSKPADRRFQRVVTRSGREAIAERIGKEERFDPDLWVIEIEDRQGRSFLDLVEDQKVP
ncbi:MAG: DUF1491 family protein [Bauldia sp.]